MEEKSASSVINSHHATETKNENEMQQAIHTKSTVQGTIHILRKHFQGGGFTKFRFFLIFSTKNLLM